MHSHITLMLRKTSSSAEPSLKTAVLKSSFQCSFIHDIYMMMIYMMICSVRICFVCSVRTFLFAVCGFILFVAYGLFYLQYADLFCL